MSKEWDGDADQRDRLESLTRGDILAVECDVSSITDGHTDTEYDTIHICVATNKTTDIKDDGTMLKRKAHASETDIQRFDLPTPKADIEAKDSGMRIHLSDEIATAGGLAANLMANMDVRKVSPASPREWADEFSDRLVKLERELSRQQRSVFLYNRDKDGYDWNPRLLRLTRLKGLGAKTVWDIGNRARLVEDLLDDENERLAEWVAEKVPPQYRDDVEERLLEAYHDAEEKRSEGEADIAEQLDDWHRKHEEIEGLTPAADGVEEALSGHNVQSVQRLIAADIIIDYARNQGMDVPPAPEMQEFKQTVEAVGPEALGPERYEDLFDISDRSLRRTHQALEYFRG